MNTQEIMQTALNLVGFSETPGDCAIYVPGENIKTVMFGIDIEAPELLLAKQLGVDCAISHHPEGGTAFSRYHEVFRKHKDLLVKHGVPEKTAIEVVEPLAYNKTVYFHKENHDHIPSVARLLKMPFMNIHNPCDELGRKIMDEKIQGAIKPNWTLQDVINCLMELKEFQTAATDIEIRMGKPENKAGKVAVVHGAATNGGCEIAKCYFDHGIDTVIYIHISAEDLGKLKKISNGNLIISGHISSDALGINPLIEALEQKGIRVIRMSGL